MKKPTSSTPSELHLKFTGAFPVRTDDLAAHVLKALVARHGQIPTDAYEDVIAGLRQPGRRRQPATSPAWLCCWRLLPFTVPGETVNRLCASACRLLSMLTAPSNRRRRLVYRRRRGYAPDLCLGHLKNFKAFGRDAEMRLQLWLALRQ